MIVRELILSELEIVGGGECEKELVLEGVTVTATFNGNTWIGDAQASGWTANGNQYFIPGWNETCQRDDNGSGEATDPYLDVGLGNVAGAGYDAGKMAADIVNEVTGNTGDYWAPITDAYCSLTPEFPRELCEQEP